MRARHLLQVVFFALVVAPFMALFIGLRVRGRQHLAAPGPFVLVANHSSHLDTVSLLYLFPLTRLHRIRPVAAADYFERTALRSWFSRTFFNILPIARLKAERTVHPIDAMLEALRAGDSLILFPEGTRQLDGAMGPFKPGVAHLLEAMPGLPIVPALLVNMGRSLPKGEFLPVPFLCEIRIGEPMSPTGTRDEVMQQIEDAVRHVGMAAPPQEPRRGDAP